MTDLNLLKQIKISRLLKELTQKDMAKKLNVSVPTYSRFERGSTKTNYEFLQKVSVLLDFDLNKYNTLHDNISETTSASCSVNTAKKVADLITLLEQQQTLNNELLKQLRLLSLETA